MPARILARDQDRQLERVDEVERRELLRRSLGDEQVAVLERPAKDRIGTTLRSRRVSFLGPDGVVSLEQGSDRISYHCNIVERQIRRRPQTCDTPRTNLVRIAWRCGTQGAA
jgi:hypothetical protein